MVTRGASYGVFDNSLIETALTLGVISHPLARARR